MISHVLPLGGDTFYFTRKKKKERRKKRKRLRIPVKDVSRKARMFLSAIRHPEHLMIIKGPI